MIESIGAQYISVSISSPLSASSYIKLSVKLRLTQRKVWLILKTLTKKSFTWCHITHLNQLKTHSKRITKADKNRVNDLDYKGIEFPVSRKDYSHIERKKVFINVF